MITMNAMADLVKARLVANATTLGVTSTRIVRSWRPIRDSEELLDTTLTVVPTGQLSALDTRKSTREIYQIDIIVQRHLGANADSAADTVDGVCDNCMKLFRLTSLVNNSGAIVGYVEDISRDVVFSHEHFDKFRIFTSQIQLSIVTKGTKA